MILSMSYDGHLIKLALPTVMMGEVLFQIINPKLFDKFGMRSTTLYFATPIMLSANVILATSTNTFLTLTGFVLLGVSGVFYNNYFLMVKNINLKNSYKIISLIALIGTLISPLGGIICGHLTYYFSWRWFRCIFCSIATYNNY